MGEINFVKSLIFISLFTIAILSYAINFAGDNNAVIDISDDPELNELHSNLVNEQSTNLISINSSDKAFSESTISATEETTTTGGQFKENIKSPRKSLNYILKGIRTKIFGNDSNFLVILNAFFSFIILVGILYIWKTWKGGNPD